MKMGMLGVTAVAFAIITVGCAVVVGLDHDYQLVDGAGAGTEVSSASGGGSGTTGSDGATSSNSGAGETAQLSCAGLSSTCGPDGNESCCASRIVPGGSYNRSNNVNYRATVSDFRLDRFEITVGRFRAFVSAYPGSKPTAGAGAHPKIAGSGWNDTWNTYLSVDQPGLIEKVTACNSKFVDAGDTNWPTYSPVENENLPMNCITWYEAFAFCAWDGGRLPTEAEWNYAAAGGDEQRTYPWGSATLDLDHAVYDCMGNGPARDDCEFTDILRVGSKRAGDGKWEQADLAGSVWEWNLDWYSPYTNPCNDCINPPATFDRVVRGGSWAYEEPFQRSSFRGSESVKDPYRDDRTGGRCVKTP